MNKIRNERGEELAKERISTTEIQRTVRNYCEQLHAKKLENLCEMENFLETYSLPKLNLEEAENLNRQKTNNEIEAAIKKFPAHKSPGPYGFTGEFYQTFKGELINILLKLFQKIQ